MKGMYNVFRNGTKVSVFGSLFSISAFLSFVLYLWIRLCLSIHPSIFSRLSGAGSRGQQSKQRCPDFPLPRHFLQLFRGDTEAFPG